MPRITQTSLKSLLIFTHCCSSQFSNTALPLCYFRLSCGAIGCKQRSGWVSDSVMWLGVQQTNICPLMSSFGPCTRLSTIQKLCFPQKKNVCWMERKCKIYCETKKNILSHKILFLASFLKNRWIKANYLFLLLFVLPIIFEHSGQSQSIW